MIDLPQAIQHAVMLHRRGQFEEAIISYRWVLSLDPNQLAAYQAIGELLIKLARPAEALEPLEHLTQSAPQFSGAWMLLAQARGGCGQIDPAIAAYKKVLEFAPQHVPALYAMADLQNQAGRPVEAIAPLELALQVEPDNAAIHNLLARAYARLNRHLEALSHHQRAADLLPQLESMTNNYGVALHRAGRLGEAEIQLRKATTMNPAYAAGWTNLGSLLFEQGRVGEASDCYQKAMRLQPDSIAIHSIYLYTLHFNPALDEADIAAQQKHWVDRHIAAIASVAPDRDLDKNPDRRLRVGYLSADFRQHVVGRFLEPIIRCHNREKFEVFCYSDTTANDAVTDRMRSSANHWLDTSSLNDQLLAERVVQDQIDILLDLTGHMENSRLGVFARKPASVQISHIGYPASTGLPQIAFRITDRHLDPSPPSDANETLLYLPDSFYLYTNPLQLPVQHPPVNQNGFITFGSLNSPAKTSDAAVELWAGVLRAVPGSKLLLAVPPDLSVNDSITSRFALHQIDQSRLILEPTRSFDEYLKLYNRIDIALDPQPYGGGITSCDALWMGIPIVSLIGKTSVGRIGASLLRNLGLDDLLAENPEQYILIATTLAGDPERLLEYRHSLRSRLEKSPLMDAQKYTTHLEQLYRKAFRTIRSASSSPTAS